MDTWQDISTAPKDGDLIVVGLLYDGYWLYQSLVRREPYGDAFIEDSPRRGRIETATHWLALPPPPGQSFQTTFDPATVAGA